MQQLNFFVNLVDDIFGKSWQKELKLIVNSTIFT
ncbi:hypothetical protein BD809_1103 [Aquimarina intermedia]|uniref:Uncharacterized protein n=1 Tax=Aquimarina intermedia TaxID=350814 RepID=A0A5S5BVD2_9FLAO|nr:hypothetical protein BD809_1103 [Aquimarina intermedia]